MLRPRSVVLFFMYCLACSRARSDATQVDPGPNSSRAGAFHETRTPSSSTTPDRWRDLYLAGKLAEAAAYADSLVLASPQDSLACFKAYVVSSQIGRHPQADHLWWCAFDSPARVKAIVGWAGQLATSNPNNPLALLAAASASLAARDGMAATAYLDRAIHVNAPAAYTSSLLGSAALVMGDMSVAESHFRKAMQLDARISSATVSLGVVLERRGQVEAAREAYLQAIARDSLNAAGYYNLGRLKCERGEGEAGTALLKRAILIYPGYVQAHLLLAARFLLEGKWSAVLAECDPVFSEAPSVAQAHVFAGVALYRLGRSAEARAHLQRALQLSPHGDEAQAARMLLKQIDGR